MDKVNILMVDDQPAKLLTYEAILGELGDNLIKATSGREALEHLLKTDVAVVLLDVSMPELDGFELAKMIRQHPRFQQTAIIFISAVHLTDIDRLKGYQRGAVDYISVPVVPELLLAKVSVFAELHRRSCQLEKMNRELRKAEEESGRLSRQLLQIQDAERRRVARDLHDGLGQYLAAAMMRLQSLERKEDPRFGERLADATKLIEQALLETRTVSHLLHPPLLDQMGLASAIEWYASGFSERSGVHVNVEVGRDVGRLDIDTETAIFRIVQESLTNVHRHSASSTASVRLTRGSGVVTLEVRDDGKGLPVNGEGGGNALGVGIAGMRERVRQLRGQLEISSHPGQGTAVIANLPERLDLQHAVGTV